MGPTEKVHVLGSSVRVLGGAGGRGFDVNAGSAILTRVSKQKHAAGEVVS